MSGTCLDPGMSGVCSSFGSSGGSDNCGAMMDRCFQDEQCCDGYNCDYGECQPDMYNGNEPTFTRLNLVRMNSIEEKIEAHGQNLRPRMLFKLAFNGECPADRSPVSGTQDGHYAVRADLYGGRVEFNLKVYSTKNWGALLLCYAVNDYANYQSTGLTIQVPKLVTDRDESKLMFAKYSFSEGFSKLRCLKGFW